MIPDTSRKPGGSRPPATLALFAAALALFVVLLAALLLTRSERFSAGERIFSANVRSVVVSRRETAYPSTDAAFVPGGARSAFVYVALRDVQGGARFGAEIERRGRESAVSRLFSGGGLKVSERDVRLSPPASPSAGARTPGTISFEVRADGGGRLPAGGYTFRFKVDGAEAAEKRFVVG